MKADVFDAGMAILLATFPNLAIEERTLKTWRALLADIPDEPFLRAVTALCQGEKQVYPGTNVAALIREKARASSEEMRLLPGEAWGLVKAAVRHYGAYRKPTFPDENITRAVDILGWQDFCLSGIDEESAWRAHFMRIYESLVKREEENRLYALVEGEVRKILPAETIGELVGK
jgi:hypothetical protein